jgi:hypothetical protein
MTALFPLNSVGNRTPDATVARYAAYGLRNSITDAAHPFAVVKPAADAAAGTNFATVVYTATTGCAVVGAALAALVATFAWDENTDAVITIKKYNAAGVFQANAYTFTAGAKSVAAGAKLAFTTAGTLAERTMISGDYLVLNITKAGGGVSLPAVSLQLSVLSN